MNNLEQKLQTVIKGEVIVGEEAKQKYAHDTSIFEITPEAAVAPKDVEDISSLINYVNTHKKEQPNLSLTARSAGTDMSGGPLTDSIVLDFTKHFNNIVEVNDDSVVVEPGVYYRDLEKVLNEKGLMYPTYPASKDLCALGGIVNNNSGGEKTLQYGKTNNYVLGLDVLLSDGKQYHISKVSGKTLEKKLSQKDFEGELYRNIHELLSKNYDLIQKSRPIVSKNSSGYNIWDAWDGKTLDLTQLICGAQGTLGFVTKAELKILPKPKYERLYVVFMKDLKNLPHFVQDVLALKPTTLEITDDHTFKIYMRYAREMASIIGAGGLINTARLFLPETLLIMRHGMPKLITLVEFEGDDTEELQEKMKTLDALVKKHEMIGHKVRTKLEANKYWKLRRDTFKLLREKIKNKKSTPFVDDIIVRPEYLPGFLPELTKIMDASKLFYTISGHLGDGNLHIIPLMNLKDPKERAKIYPVTDKVYDLVLKYHGSLSAEHNDGLMRSPYLKEQFGEKVYKIFEEVKHIFDPNNIFNPHKKVGVTKAFAQRYVIKS